MEKLLEIAATQVPGLVVLTVLVTIFLRREKERDAFIQQLHAEHIDARRQSVDAIKENTRATLQLSEAIREMQRK